MFEYRCVEQLTPFPIVWMSKIDPSMLHGGSHFPNPVGWEESFKQFSLYRRSLRRTGPEMGFSTAAQGLAATVRNAERKDFRSMVCQGI